MKTLTKTNTTFKKSVLSFLVISAVAGSFISWDNYLPRGESAEVKAAFQDRSSSIESILTQNSPHIDSDALALIAEENLTSELDAEVDAQVALQAEVFIKQSESHLFEDQESGEPTDVIAALALSGDELLVQGESEQLLKTASPRTFATMVDDQEALFMMVSPLLFAFDSSEINPNYYEALNDSARFIQDEAKTEDTLWQVVGYADLSGNALYNSKLAKKRAQKVAAYLVDKGVDEAQLSVVSLGASNPLNSERSIENNRNERRVEIHRYQAEITTLAEQSKQQMQDLRVAKKAQQKRALVAQQQLQQKATISPEIKKVIEPEMLVESEKLVESETTEMSHNSDSELIEKEQIKRLTTAMEL